MIKKTLVFLFTMYLVNMASSCHPQIKDKNIVKEKNRLSDSIKKDIPIDKDGRPMSYYRNKSDIEKKVGLLNLENGFDSLQIRLWYGYAFKDSSQLIIFRKNKDQWSGEFYNLLYKMTERGDSIKSIEKTVSKHDPKSGWNYLVSRLLALKIDSLPDKSRISDYPSITDGDGVVVEIATVDQYRIYFYNTPSLAQTTIWQARNMEQILELIENQFAFKRLRKF